MTRPRTDLGMLLLYVGVIAVAAIGIAFSIGTVVTASANIAQVAQRDKTLLELQIESSREIRQALARKQPAVEPLPPIMAKPAHALAANTVATSPQPTRLSHGARNAFAAAEWSQPPSYQTPSYSVADRHSSNF